MNSPIPDQAEVQALIMAVLDLPLRRDQELTRDSTPEWDSLKHMELVFALEDKYGIRFDESEFAALTSPGDIAAALAKKLAP